MQNTVRTTIRIREDLLKLSRQLALDRDTSLQDVINELLAKGYSQVSDLDSQKEAWTKIDNLRNSLKDQKINVNKLVAENRKELLKRTEKLLRNTK